MTLNKIPKDYVCVKVKRKNICRVIGYEFWLIRNLTGKQKTAFKKYLTYLDFKEFEKIITPNIIDEKIKKVTYYFGNTQRFSIHSKNDIDLICRCLYNIWLLIDEGVKLEREDSVVTCYQFLSLNSKLSHYRCTSIAVAICIEFNLIPAEDIKHIIVDGKYNWANELFELGKEHTKKYDKRKSDSN